MGSGGIAILVLMISSSIVSAQPVAVNVTVGMSEAPMNGVEQTFSEPTTLSPAIGFTIGIAVPVRIAQWLAFEPEMLVAQQRNAYTTPDTENFGDPLANVSIRLDFDPQPPTSWERSILR